jgi:hypothetical protein
MMPENRRARATAVRRRRYGAGWFAVGFVFGLLGLIVAASMSARPDPRAHDTEALG